ncbi:MAG: hypothetical protein RJB66_309 [Pseudomonadota bacterium]|jgi:methyl-accepting chemotaxis protein
MKSILQRLLYITLITAPTPSFGVTKETPPITLEPQISVSTYMGLVEEYLAGVLRTVKTLTLTSEAKSASWQTIKPLLEQYGKDLRTDAAVWYVLPDGKYYSTETGGIAAQNLQDRDYFAALFEGNIIEGNLVISKSTGHRSIVVAAPVRSNGKVVAAIGVSVRARLLSQLVEDHMKLPKNTYFYAMNDDAKISIHRYVDRMFKHVKDVGDEALQKDFKQTFKNDKGTFNYDLNGKKLTSVYEKSIPLGWYFFIAQEEKTIK